MNQTQRVNLSHWTGWREGDVGVTYFIYENTFYIGTDNDEQDVRNEDSESAYEVHWSPVPNNGIVKPHSISVRKRGFQEDSDVLLSFERIMSNKIRFSFKGSGRISIRYSIKRNYNKVKDNVTDASEDIAAAVKSRRGQALSWNILLASTT